MKTFLTFFVLGIVAILIASCDQQQKTSEHDASAPQIVTESPLPFLTQVSRPNLGQYFKKFAEFEIRVPGDASIKNFKTNFGYCIQFNSGCISDDVLHPSHPLEPAGSIDTVVIYTTTENMLYQECVDFIQENGYPVNAQGLAQAFAQGAIYFPTDLFVVAPDYPENLWKRAKDVLPWSPCIHYNSEAIYDNGGWSGQWIFGLGGFGWETDGCCHIDFCILFIKK